MNIVDPRHDEARAELLDRIEHGTEVDWFNQLDPAALERTGGRTLTEAWRAGDRETVERLVDEWYAASRASAERHQNDPEFLALVKARRAEYAAQDAEVANKRAELAAKRAEDARARRSA